ncbi:diguanylate cyclase [Edwardsiella piscicida]|uniref:sensor domain-containing diguanylate cyclase n=1 Tax=Edwardsiella piscicida TaxID=1263550 RepID=UPI001CF4E2D9|nr:sensor domain-containing diguanylate cyclase [Edwardsiella piscicida]UCQ56931.1 diguanylate cyclase [Edwardsiella piscicida]
MNDSDPQLARYYPELVSLTTLPHDAGDEVYHHILGLGLKILNMQVGVISRVNHRIASVVFQYPALAGLQAGHHLALAADFSASVVAQGALVVQTTVSDAQRQRLPPPYRALPVASYIGIPLTVGGEFYGLLELLSRNGRNRPFSSGQIACVRFMASSIGHMLYQSTLLQRNAQLLRENQRINEIIDKAFKYAAIGMALTSPEGYYRRANRTFCKMLGYSEAEMLNTSFQSITHPDDLALDLQYLQDLAQRRIEFYSVEKRYLKRDGAYLWVRLSVSAIFEQDAVLLYISQIQDIGADKVVLQALAAQREQLEQLNQALTLQASIDYLTGIRNRRSFVQHFAPPLQHARSLVALALFDLDYFKHYNDTYGHQAGDEALIYFSNEMRRHFKEPDSLIGRFGGEEFIALCSADGQCNILERLDKLRESLDYGSDEALPGHLTVSIGCVLVPRECVTPQSFDALVRYADEMLYQAKNTGRNRLKYRELASLKI